MLNRAVQGAEAYGEGLLVLAVELEKEIWS